MTANPDPHAGWPLLRAGAKPGQAARGVVLLHGRGSSARQILGLMPWFGRDDIAYAAPEAAANSWWPVSFLAPQGQLEPWLSSAVAAVARAVAALEDEGIPRAAIGVAGFSQGACLALEFAARTGGPLAFVAALSGGLVGTGDAGGAPDPALYGHREKRFDYSHRLDGVPIHVACHAQDPHIPLARAERSAALLRDMGARAELVVAPGPGHEITAEGAAALRDLAAS